MKALRRVVATFGNPDCGRLGLGNVETAVEFPQVVKFLAGVQAAAVAVGGAHTAVLATDGTVFTHGLNDQGQLGHSEEKTEVWAPQEVPLPVPAIAIAAGNFHTLCVTEGGLVWAWGSNKNFQLGLGTDVSGSATPRLVAALKSIRIASIAAGAEHSLAVSSSGELYSWGCGGSGRLGHGSPSALRFWAAERNEPKPRLVRALETQTIRQASAGHMHSACVSSDNTAFVFGSGRFKQLGRMATDADAPTPIEVKGPGAWMQVACGGTHTLGVTGGGAVASWGADQHGCLGRGQLKAGVFGRPEPIPDIVADQVAAGWKHSAAIDPQGKLYTWGWGGSQGTAFSVESRGGGGGQLGLGSDFDYWKPGAVTHLATGPGGGGGVPQTGSGGQLWRVIQVSCGANHTAAIFELENDVLL